MDVLDPRLAVIAAGAALVGSERVRKIVGRGFGYVAAGAIRVGSPAVNAGRQVVEEARDVAGHEVASRRQMPRPKASAV
jgi:hypothetical protein